MIPPCDHTGVPIHFHSSTTAGAASLMSLRIVLKVCPRQSPSSAILLSIRSDAEGPSSEAELFMFISYHYQTLTRVWRRAGSGAVGQTTPAWP